MGLTERQQAAHDFFIAFGKAHGAEISVDGERIDRSYDELLVEAMCDYPSADTKMPIADFPIKLVFPIQSQGNPNAPEEHIVSAQVKNLRHAIERVLPGYDTDPKRYSGLQLANGVYAREVSHGLGLKGKAYEVTIHEPSEPQEPSP